VRHGIVAFDASASVTSREWPDLLDRFNASALTPESLPSQSGASSPKPLRIAGASPLRFDLAVLGRGFRFQRVDQFLGRFRYSFNGALESERVLSCGASRATDFAHILKSCGAYLLGRRRRLEIEE